MIANKQAQFLCTCVQINCETCISDFKKIYIQLHNNLKLKMFPHNNWVINDDTFNNIRNNHRLTKGNNKLS